MNGLNKQIGKRHINSACLITSQSGSKGNWRFPRKLSWSASMARFSPLQGASRRGTMYSWHLVLAIHDRTIKSPKARQGLHCKVQLLVWGLRALGGVREAFQEELKQHSSLLASDASSFLEQKQLTVPWENAGASPLALTKCSATSCTVNWLHKTNLRCAKPREH